MLSFNLSFIDIILTIAVVVLLLLFLTEEKESQPKIRVKLPIKDLSKLLENLKGLIKNAQEKLSISQSPAGFQKCLHHFGYLKELPEKTPVPAECFGCPKTLQCLSLKD
jgi:hypothetical protein